MVDPNIKKKADDIRTKIKGKEVRESLASGLEEMSSDVVQNEDRQSNVEQRQSTVEGRQTDVENRFDDQIAGNTDIDEVIDARRPEGEEAYPTLRRRLDAEHQEVTSQLAQKVYYAANVTEMKNMIGLKEGDTVITLGYYKPNDGGGGEYVVKKDSTLVEDNGSIHNLLDELKAELIIKNSTVNVKQFGAKGNCNYFDNETKVFYEDREYSIESQDDTTFIQNAYDFVKSNKNNLGSLEVFYPNGDYGVSSTIHISTKADSDFDYSTIHVMTGGTFEDKYIFKINAINNDSWDVPYDHRKGYFKNVNAENKRYLLNVKFILSGVSYEFKNILTECMTGTLIYVKEYVDRKTIKNVFVLFPRLDTDIVDDNKFGTNFHIALHGQGDAAYIRDIFMGGTGNLELCNYPDGDPGKLLFISAGDVSVDGVINGLIRLNYSANVNIRNFHGEKGSLESFNSQVSLTDSFFYRRPTFTPIVVREDEYAGGTGEVPHDSKFSNIIFENKYDWYDYDEDLPEFDLRDNSGIVKIEQCYRRVQPFGRPKNRVFSSGVKVRLRDRVEKPNFSFFEVKGDKVTYPNTKISVDNKASYLGAMNETGIKWHGEMGSYYYKAFQLIDGARLIGKSVNNERSVTKVNNTSYTRLSVDDVVPNSATRFYRGRTSGNYTEYVDVPNAVSTGYSDNGYGVNGYLWKPFSGDPISDVNVAYDVEYWNENIRVTRGSAPNYGNWKRNDVVYNRNPQSGAYVGWICTESGKPGIWKGFGLIE